MTTLKIGQFPWLCLPRFIAVNILAFIARFVMFLLGLPACAIGVWFIPKKNFRIESPSQFPCILRWWDSKVSTTPELWWWNSTRWQHKPGDRFSVWWWRAVRNPASNFSRGPFFGTDEPDDWQYVRITEGSWDGRDNPKDIAKRGKKSAYKVTWSTKYPLFGLRWHYLWSDSKYLQVRIGFKLGQQYEGLGWTFRINPFRGWDHGRN
jgi:hypothetical protein